MSVVGALPAGSRAGSDVGVEQNLLAVVLTDALDWRASLDGGEEPVEHRPDPRGTAIHDRLQAFEELLVVHRTADRSGLAGDLALIRHAYLLLFGRVRFCPRTGLYVDVYVAR